MHLGIRLVQVKAHSIFEDLSEADVSIKPFSVSTSQFSKYTTRCNFHNMRMTGKAASADTIVVIHCVG